MLYFSHSLVVCSSLLLLIFPVALGQSGVAMALSIGVEHSHVKKMPAAYHVPKTQC